MKTNKLTAPFAADEIQWKPQTVSKDKTRALAVAYIDARAVADRLDEVFGLEWADSYRVLPDGDHVECTITINGISRSDVGEVNPGGYTDKMKTLYSDAFKRAAVKWGIGRYLYRLPMVWVGYDDHRRQLKETPRLPIWALPNGKPNQAPSTDVGHEPIIVKQAETVTEEQVLDAADYSGDIRGEASPTAQAARNGQRPKRDENRAADMRASLESNPTPTWASIAQAVILAEPHYKASKHVYNAAALYDGLPDDYNIVHNKRVKPESAMKIFDWLLARVEAKHETVESESEAS